jgi:uroporphyrinogen decarboxylase
VFDRIRETDVALIYFALNGAHLLPAVRDCGADMIGMDWRVDLAQAFRELDRPVALQGNLDPCVLMAGPEVIKQKALEVLRSAADLPGHVFNLGHGVLPNTPVENVEALVQFVQGYRR